MESQQASEPGLYGQDDGPGVAPAQVATTFHRFPNLPAELQMDIWDHALSTSARSPSVLCFQMGVERTSKTLIACFNPDEHVASATLAHRALLGTCRHTRQKALESLNILTLFRLDESSRTITEFRIPFDFENSCFCIEGWKRHGMGDVISGNITGMDFAKRVKRLAFVVQNDDIDCGDGHLLFYRHIEYDMPSLALLFHNATQIGGITRSMSEFRHLVTEEAFISMFSFQGFTQKEMVGGLLLTNRRYDRIVTFRYVIRMAFEGWRERLWAVAPKVTGGSVTS